MGKGNVAKKGKLVPKKKLVKEEKVTWIRARDVISNYLAHVSLPWIRAYRDEECKRLETQKTVLKYARSFGRLKYLMKALVKYDKLQGQPITLRAFSVKCFRNSKSFEMGIILPFLEIAWQYNQEFREKAVDDLATRDRLALLGILPNPTIVEIAGSCIIYTDRGRMDCGLDIHSSFGISSNLFCRDMNFDLSHVGIITFIENQTSFEDYVMSDIADNEMVVCSTGSIGPTRQRFYQKISEAITLQKVRVWGDIDLGGFELFYALRDVFPKLEAYNMSWECVEKYRNHGLRHKEEYWSLMQTAKDTNKYPFFKDVIEKLLKYKITIEQEVFLLDVFPFEEELKELGIWYV